MALPGIPHQHYNGSKEKTYQILMEWTVYGFLKTCVFHFLYGLDLNQAYFFATES